MLFSLFTDKFVANSFSKENSHNQVTFQIFLIKKLQTSLTRKFKNFPFKNISFKSLFIHFEK